ncbi:hypothetical protein HK414_26240 [Ramlibacter terrae]|uniref:Uncharacterized protein n=1 Tax=Ramlibacter terrae TaxID=2732511 RepID=A0ABX6P132_9BURK|nr:hypothetical protein HK414_26240 [Ramlibacter terrae]
MHATGGESPELRPTVGVEPLHCFQQADGGVLLVIAELDVIVEPLAVVRGRYHAHIGQVQVEQFGARVRVGIVPQAPPQGDLVAGLR